jgi:hypothetical protein
VIFFYKHPFEKIQLTLYIYTSKQKNKTKHMKKLFLLTVAALLVTGVTFADNGKKAKKCTKSCCKKSGKTCGKQTDKTAKI